MNSEINIVHVIPVPCIFESAIQQRADACGHACFYYEIKRRWRRNLTDLWHLFKYSRQHPDSIFLFHQVPHLRLAVLSLLLPKFRFGLLYWGGDYYSAFLDEADFEQHCIRKSPLLRHQHYAPRTYGRSTPLRLLRRTLASRLNSWLRWPRSMLGFLVVGRAMAIFSLSPKQFRIVRYFYFRAFGSYLRTPQFPTLGYGLEPMPEKVLAMVVPEANELRVLICHSATPTVAPHQSLDLLRKYKELWGVKIHIRGFLSYSGGDEAYRDALGRELTQASSFADSVVFERKFLKPDEIRARLVEIDLAVFSCLRDEGVGLLTQLVNLGGLVSFNRFSFDYDFFRRYSRSKVLTHEQLLDLSPAEILRKRSVPPGVPPSLVNYEEFDCLLRNIANCQSSRGFS